MADKNPDSRKYLLNLTKEQMVSLGVVAAVREVTKADLLREGVDLVLQKYSAEIDAKW